MKTQLLSLKSIRESGFVKDSLVVLLSSLLIGLSGIVKIPLPITPVPIIIHVQVLLLSSLLLGRKRAFFVAFLFLVQGILGLPVFAGGASGLAHLFGPTGGYLLSYPLAAYVTGAVFERFNKTTFFNAFASIFLGNLLVFIPGVFWLSFFVGGIKKALILGFLPFILVDIFKCVIAAKLAQSIKRWVSSSKRV